MVEFLSFFLVLTVGSKPVELTVTPPVVRVEALLDGREIATLTGRPWIFMCDFGVDPEPRELVVIGRDGAGREIDRTVQWINLGVQPSRARLSFQEDADGHIRSIGLSWESVGQRQPKSIEVTFDGEPLVVENPRHIPLPPYDPDSAHFIGAEVRFSDTQIMHLDASFGGEYGEEISTELTALPVLLAPKARMPSRKKLSTWFVKNDQVLQVQAVDKGPADIVIVRDPAAQRRLVRLGNAAIVRHQGPLSGREIRRRREPRAIPGDAYFSGDTHLRFVAPYAVPLYARGDVTPDLFARSERISGEDTGLLWLTHQISPRGFPFELGGAVAVAGMTAHASSRRRAVVVILDADPGDGSRDAMIDNALPSDRRDRGLQMHDYRPAAVRRYLSLLRVPLYVWSTAPGIRTAWRETQFVGDNPKRPGSTEPLFSALRSLDRDLKRQRIVWLRGRHLPADIELSAEADGLLSLAGVDERCHDCPLPREHQPDGARP